MTQRIFDRLFAQSHIQSQDNIVVVTGESEQTQLVSLSFILGLILARQPELAGTVLASRNPEKLRNELDILKKVGASPKFCTIRDFEENKDNVITDVLCPPQSYEQKMHPQTFKQQQHQGTERS